MEQKVLRAVMVCLLLMSMAILGRETAAYVETVNAVNALQGNNADTDGIPTVVIDAGHGGDDPGKIGINGAPEKDINLRITEKLRQYLEADGIRVVLTRETEEGLYDASAPNKKVQDMKRRIEKNQNGVSRNILCMRIHIVIWRGMNCERCLHISVKTAPTKSGAVHFVIESIIQTFRRK